MTVFNMSRSALSLMTSRLSRVISNCSGFICPWPGNECCVSSANLFAQFRSCDTCTPRSVEACTYDTPRSLIRRTDDTKAADDRLCLESCERPAQKRADPEHDNEDAAGGNKGIGNLRERFEKMATMNDGLLCMEPKRDWSIKPLPGSETRESAERKACKPASSEIHAQP